MTTSKMKSAGKGSFRAGALIRKTENGDVCGSLLVAT